ncbi:hypothetical protein [Streptomyces sp. SID3212]|uniref:hypothetical protein n=1 Tax=Streptomyces sp. SID3212 TaxID=2690259 RepID=UPI00136CF13C|nr:hypothetical protein [Streptomyces sp. SID3212]MYV58029.1 hypothetical protein [Streptomyces sp. SID3212]
MSKTSRSAGRYQGGSQIPIGWYGMSSGIYSFEDVHGNVFTVERTQSGDGFCVESFSTNTGQGVIVTMPEDEIFSMLNTLIEAVG